MADRHEHCEICRGSRFINLPIYRKLTGAFMPEALLDFDMSQPTSKQFPCPECSATTSSPDTDSDGDELNSSNVWDDYCEEVEPENRSLQGALAFGFRAAQPRNKR